MRDPKDWKPLDERYLTDRPRKMLALDGGGIRGILTLCMLKKLEAELGGKPLCEYFDYIAGTSTGAIIATGLARGMSVGQIEKFYREAGPEMFQKSRFLDRLRTLYQGGNLQQKLKHEFGEHSDLGPEYLKTLLLVVTRNVTTDSPWPISSNPDARYNNCKLKYCNLRIPLWQIVRASTAAPIFFPPEVIELEKGNPKQTFVFVDGGVTPYNNPAFLLYRFATDRAYRLNWERGEDKLLLVSIGTGAAPTLGVTAEDPESFMPSTATGLPAAFMYGMLNDQDINCRTVGRCTYGDVIDRELLDMVPREGNDEGSLKERLDQPKVPLDRNLGRAFLYARYNVELSEEGLAALGFPNVDPKAVQKMDNVAPQNTDILFEIGAAAAAQVDKKHFGRFAA